MAELRAIVAWALVAAAGIGLVALYAQVCRKRWGADWPDLISSIPMRLDPDRSWPLREDLLHHLLWILKWFGLFLVAMGLGIIVGGLFFDRTLLR